ncbi:hypothetical protein [Campylobacter sp. US33a]|nr:hypothetical protein [Campylobacter sp. US33a]
MKKCEKTKKYFQHKNKEKTVTENTFSHFQQAYYYDENKFKFTRRKL